jgi:hypothetical protein
MLRVLPGFHKESRSVSRDQLRSAPQEKFAEHIKGPQDGAMIRKLKSGEYRLYSRKKNPKTGKRRNLGTFKTRAAAEKHEKAVQFFKRGG